MMLNSPYCVLLKPFCTFTVFLRSVVNVTPFHGRMGHFPSFIKSEGCTFAKVFHEFEVVHVA